MWIRLACGLPATAALAVAAIAHHSVGGNFDAGTTIEVEGEVTAIQWRNPHVKFGLSVTNENGETEDWEIETHSLSIMRRMDVVEPFVAIGDRVRVAGWPALRSPHGMFVNNMLLPGGEEFVFRFGAAPADLRWSDRLWGTTERWFAAGGDASAADRGIFRVWSTTFGVGNGFLWLGEYPLTDAARASRAAYDPATDDPLLDCGTKGMPAIMSAPYPIEFVDRGDTIVLRIEEYDLQRTIHLAPQAGQPEPSILGHSAGRWEGGSLQVETTAIDWGHFDAMGIPLSDQVRMVERFTPADDGSALDYEITVIDAETFTEPLTMAKTWVWLPDVSIAPYECAAD